MPTSLLNTSSVLMCPHGGTVTITTTNTRVKAAGDFITRRGDTFTITGCPFFLGIPYHPCVRVQWVSSALRSKVVSDMPLTQTSVGLCLAGDGLPQGQVLINVVQPRTKGD